MIRPNRAIAASDLDIQALLDGSSLRLEIMSEVRRRWDEGRPLDAKAFLAEHPECGSQKSVVLDLAFEEYCQKTETGELVDTDAYCRQFPTFEKSLRRLIAVQDYLNQNPSLMPGEVDWPETGQAFQGFHILGELGRGAFARVFLAQEVALGNRLVAVKVSTDGAGEAEILGRLQHPNIVPVYSVQEDAETGLSFVCMPYLGRTTLCDLLDRLFGQKTKPVKARSILEALRVDAEEFPAASDETCTVDPKLRSGSFVDGAVHLGRQLAEALAYSHANGVCHSDLKPSNVLIGPGGRPMLLDFNLAFQPRSMERRLGGTLPYMAPEQVRALSASPADWPPPVDERSDIFSLGLILYELLTGSLPFGPIQTNRPRGEIGAHLLEQQELGPASLREANGDVDAPLAQLVESCLAFEPADRPQTAEELAAALSRHASLAKRARRWTRRNGLLVGLSAAFLLVFCSVALYRRFTLDRVEVGKEYLDQERYDEAEDWFNRAIDSRRDLAEAFYGRGCTHQRRGHYRTAAEDYRQAALRNPAGEIFARLAYCAAMDGDRGACIQYSHDAIKAGYGSAEVYNNLGCAYRSEEQYEKSMAALDTAIGLNNRLGPAFHNRAFAEFGLAVKEDRSPNAQARADIEAAIEIGLPNVWEHLDAALIYEWAFSHEKSEPRSADYHAKAVEHRATARRLKADRETVRDQVPSLLEDRRLKDLPARPGHGGRRQRDEITYVDPFPDDSYWPD